MGSKILQCSTFYFNQINVDTTTDWSQLNNMVNAQNWDQFSGILLFQSTQTWSYMSVQVYNLVFNFKLFIGPSQNRLQSVNFHNISHINSCLPLCPPQSLCTPFQAVLFFCRHTEWLMLCIPMLTLKPLINTLLLHIEGPRSSCWSLWCQSTLSLTNTMLKNNVNFLSIPTLVTFNAPKSHA